jgi:hypothetical protein
MPQRLRPPRSGGWRGGTGHAPRDPRGNRDASQWSVAALPPGRSGRVLKASVATRPLRLGEAMLAATCARGDPVKGDPIAVIPNDLLAAELTSPHRLMVATNSRAPAA